MELRQLRYLVAVVEEGTFSAAAAKLRVAQPAVSAQVRKLEQELGQVLLERMPRGVRLTAAGEAVLPEARAALDAADGARRAIEEFEGLLRGRVNIGMVASISALDLPDILARFHGDHPHVEIHLSEDRSDRLIEALHGGDLDLAIISVGHALPASITTTTLAEELLVAAVAPGDPLAAEAEVTLGRLRGRPLMSLPRGTGLRSRIEQACDAAGFAPHVAFEASNPHMLAELAARGLGVAVLPESAARSHHPKVSTVPIVRPEIRGTLALATRRGGRAGPAARTLIAHIGRACLERDRAAPGSYA